MTTMRDVLGLCEAAKAPAGVDPDRAAAALEALDAFLGVLDRLGDDPTAKDFWAVAVAADKLSVAARAAAGR